MIKNELKVNMGGEERTLRYSMISSQKLTSDIQSEGFAERVFSNSVSMAIYLIGLGLRNKPENYSEELLMEWIDDMEQEEYDKAAEFAMQAMGFMIERERTAAKKLQGMVPTAELPIEQ